MDAINLLIVFALVAWGLQIGLGFFRYGLSIACCRT